LETVQALVSAEIRRLASLSVASDHKKFFYEEEKASGECANRKSWKLVMPVLRTPDPLAYRGYKDVAPNGALELRLSGESRHERRQKPVV
jgi:hypothetical protein